jgi:hypothetical protein
MIGAAIGTIFVFGQIVRRNIALYHCYCIGIKRFIAKILIVHQNGASGPTKDG